MCGLAGGLIALALALGSELAWVPSFLSTQLAKEAPGRGGSRPRQRGTAKSGGMGPFCAILLHKTGKYKPPPPPF